MIYTNYLLYFYENLIQPTDMAKKIFYTVAILYIICLILPFVLSKAGYDHDVAQAGLHWMVILLLPCIIPMVVLYIRLRNGHKVDMLYYLVVGIVSLLLLLGVSPLLEFWGRM